MITTNCKEFHFILTYPLNIKGGFLIVRKHFMLIIYLGELIK